MEDDLLSVIKAQSIIRYGLILGMWEALMEIKYVVMTYFLSVVRLVTCYPLF